MFINENTKQFMLDINSKELGGDVWFLTNIITTHHANYGRYIGMAYHKEDGKLIITLIKPTEESWKTIVEEVKKWAALKHACFMYEKRKQKEEDKPKKKGFEWPFGKR